MVIIAITTQRTSRFLWLDSFRPPSPTAFSLVILPNWLLYHSGFDGYRATSPGGLLFRIRDLRNDLCQAGEMVNVTDMVARVGGLG